MKTFLNQIDSSNFTENDKMILDYFIQHKNHLPYLSVRIYTFPMQQLFVFVRSLDLKDLMN